MKPILVRCLYSDDLQIVDMTLWLAANLAADLHQSALSVFELPVVDAFKRLFKVYLNKEIPNDVVSTAMYMLSMILRLEIPKQETLEIFEIIKVIVVAIKEFEPKLCFDMMRSFELIFEKQPDLVDHGLKVVNFSLKCIDQKELQAQSVKLLGLLLTADEEQVTSNFLALNGLDKLKKLLQFQTNEQQVLWLLSNVAAGNQDHIAYLMNDEIFELVLQYCGHIKLELN